jgi:hypothetical protein
MQNTIGYKQLKDQVSAEKMYNKIIRIEVQEDRIFDLNDFLTALLLKKSGNITEGDRIMSKISETGTYSKAIQWCHAIYGEDRELAETISNEINPDDRTIDQMIRIFKLRPAAL